MSVTPSQSHPLKILSNNLLSTASKNVSHNVSHNFSQTDTPSENVSHNTSLKVQQTKQGTRTEGHVAPRSSSLFKKSF